MTQACARHGCRKTALRKFCSDACRIAHHNGLRPPASRVRVSCQGCGKAFQGRPDQKTCGATCRSRLFRAKKRSEAVIRDGVAPGAVDWGQSTPFSPAELRQRVQDQLLAPGVEFSWLPASPKNIRVRRARHSSDQLRLDFGLGEPPPESDEP